MNKYRVFFRIGMYTFWKEVQATNAREAKESVERSFWVLKASRKHIAGGTEVRSA